MKQTWSIINNFCHTNTREVDITLKVNEIIITDLQVIVDKINIFFLKIGYQIISEVEKNNNVNVRYKQYLTNQMDARFQFEGDRQLITDQYQYFHRYQKYLKSHALAINLTP